MYVQVLVGSDLIKSSVEERSLLKNLGSWLGKITIGKNQVLRAREIDPKSLIIEVSFLLFCCLVDLIKLELDCLRASCSHYDLILLI